MQHLNLPKPFPEIFVVFKNSLSSFVNPPRFPWFTMERPFSLSFLECVGTLANSGGRYSIYISDVRGSRRHSAAHVESQIVPLFRKSLIQSPRQNTVVADCPWLSAASLTTLAVAMKNVLFCSNKDIRFRWMRGVIMVVTLFTRPGDDVTVYYIESTVDRFAVDGEAAGKCLTVCE